MLSIGADDRLVAKCYTELGNVTKEKGEYDESLRYHRKSLQIFERLDDIWSAADSHLNIAEIHKAKGELKQAMNEYEKGLTLYEDVFVDEANKTSDSGTDVSLNSSSFSDFQRTRALSKSDDALLHTSMTDDDIPRSSPLLHSNTARILSTPSLDTCHSSRRISNALENHLHGSASAADKAPNESLSSSYTSIRHGHDETTRLLPSSMEDLFGTVPLEPTCDVDDIFELREPPESISQQVCTRIERL